MSVKQIQPKTILGKIWREIYHPSSLILIAVLLLLGLFTWRMMPEDHTFHNQYLSAGQSAARILTDHRMCESIELCNGRHWFFVGGLKQGMEMQLFGITDKVILDEITQQFTRIFLQTPQMKRANIRAYPITHDEFLSTGSPTENKIFDIYMERR